MPDRKVHPLLGPASVNIGRIEGGIGATSVAASCGMEVCFTYHPADEALLIAETDSLVAEWRARQNPLIGLEVRELHNVQPFSTNPAFPSIRRSPGRRVETRCALGDFLLGRTVG
jgi:hypothetical protein